MQKIIFTQQLRRFTEVPEVDTSTATLRDALDAAFTVNQQLRGYILDEQGHLRPNVVIFIDGHRVSDHITLNNPLAADSIVYVLQALSGG